MNLGKIGAPALHLGKSIPSFSEAGATIAQHIGPELHTAQVAKMLNETKSMVSFARKMAKPLNEAGMGAHALESLPKHLSAVKQLSFDVARLKAETHLAKLAMQAGSSAAASAIAFMKPMTQHAQAVLDGERSMVHGYGQLIREYGDMGAGSLGKMALAGEKLLKNSTIGKGLLNGGKILASEGLGNALTKVGVASAAWKTFEKSGADSKLGKLAHSGLAGAMDYGFSKAPALLGKTPAAAGMALYDSALKYGGRALGYKDAETEGFSLSKWAEGTSNVYMNIGKSIWNQDSSPLDVLHKQNMAGTNGKILQGYAMMGESIADAMDPVYGKMIDWGSAASNGFTKSLSWWQSH